MSSEIDEACLKDPKIRGHIIYYEFRSGKPIFECYKNFCERMGPNSLDFPDFEFWFQRFSAGNFNFEYDRGQDPKYRTLTDMPVHIFGKILENLGDDYQFKYRFTLRNVCKSFRAIADSWNPNIKKFSISSSLNNIDLNLDDQKFEYKDKNLAVDDIASVLVHPKLKLEKFDIWGDGKEFMEKLSLKLASLKINKFYVEKIYLSSHWSWESWKAIIPFLQGETAEFVGSLSEIAELVDKMGDTVDGISTVGFPRITITCPSYMRAYMKDATKIVKNLLQFSNLKMCSLNVELKKTVQLKKNIQRFGAKIQEDHPEIFHYPIPYSADFFEIEIQPYEIRIERKSP